MTGFVVAGMCIVALVVLDALAVHFGVDTREGFGE